MCACCCCVCCVLVVGAHLCQIIFLLLSSIFFFLFEQIFTQVRPMHIEFVEPSKRHADVIIPEGGHNKVRVHFLFFFFRLRLFYSVESHTHDVSFSSSYGHFFFVLSFIL